MAQKDDDKKKEYQRRYYQEHIKGNPEKREKRNATQRKYASSDEGRKKNRSYHEKTYTRIPLDVRTEVAEKYKRICNAQGVSYTAPLHKAIQEFIKKFDDET